MMHFFKKTLQTNRFYFLAVLLLIVIALFFNPAIAIPIYTAHPAWLNVFFVNYTFMADGVFAIALLLFYFFYLRKKETGYILLIALAITSGSVQLIKNLFSSGKTAIFFEKGQYLFFTDEAELANYHAFPSGHTAIAFAICTVLLLTARNKKMAWFLLPAAVLMAFSRMYLAQHSLLEVVAGAGTGTISALLGFCLVNHIKTVKNPLKKWQGFTSPPTATIQPHRLNF